MKKWMLALAACFLMAGNGAASGAAAEEGSFKATGECWYFANASVLDLSVSKSQCNVKITTSDVPSLKSGKEGKADGYVFIRTDQRPPRTPCAGRRAIRRWHVHCLFAEEHRRQIVR